MSNGLAVGLIGYPLAVAAVGVVFLGLITAGNLLRGEPISPGTSSPAQSSSHAAPVPTKLSPEDQRRAWNQGLILAAQDLRMKAATSPMPSSQLPPPLQPVSRSWALLHPSYPPPAQLSPEDQLRAMQQGLMLAAQDMRMRQAKGL